MPKYLAEYVTAEMDLAGATMLKTRVGPSALAWAIALLWWPAPPAIAAEKVPPLPEAKAKVFPKAAPAPGATSAIVEDHPETTSHDLFRRYYDAERYGEVEQVLKLELADRGRRLGSTHLKTLSAYDFLGTVYKRQGRMDEAEQAFRKHLALVRDAVGAQHKEAQESAEALAWFYEDRRRFIAAEPVYRDLLAVRERTLGPNHLDTLNALEKLGGFILRQGRYDEALAIRKRVRDGRIKHFGEGNPEVDEGEYVLPHIESNRRNFNESMARADEDIRKKEARYGPDHAITLQGVDFIAQDCVWKYQLGHAETFARRALEARERTLGTDDPQTVASARRLVEIFLLQERTDRAQELIDRYLADFERHLGPEQALTVEMMILRGDVYARQSRWADAADIYNRALRARANLLGPDAELTLEAMEAVARSYRALERYAEAAPLFQALLIARERRGKHDERSSRTRGDLAGIYRALGKHREADALWAM